MIREQDFVPTRWVNNLQNYTGSKEAEGQHVFTKWWKKHILASLKKTA
jgi:hypothetical protein